MLTTLLAKVLAPKTLRSGACMVVLALALGAGSSAHAQAPTLSAGNATVLGGQPFRLELRSLWFDEVQGFSLSIAFPPNPPIGGLDIVVNNTLVGALDPDFVQANIFVSTGQAVLGVLIDSIPPFGEPLLAPVGIALPIAEVVGTALAISTPQTIPFNYVDGLGSPPTQNLFVIGNQSVAPSSMTGGTLQINVPVSTTPVFMRGDAYLNGILDISDIIFVLFHIFVAGPAPLCRDAADANDSGDIDVADGVYLISYLFANGPAPYAPFPSSGPDTTADSLNCLTWIP